MRISQRGLDAIKRHEGLRLHAYPDPATGGEPWTIGYGRAHGVTQGQQISADTAEQYLREDLQWVEDAIKETVTAPLTQGQYDAICSLIYNIGEGAWRGSTMLKRLNERQYMQAAAEFIRWNKANGKVIPGLTNRRVLEQKMFESEGEPEIDTSPEPVQETPKSVHVPPRPDQEPYEAPQPDWPAAAPTYTRPQPEKPKMAIPAIVAALLPTLIESIPKLGKLFGSGSAVAERNIAAATAAMKIAQEAVGAVNAQETVERIKTDPAAAAAATQAIESRWFELVEGGGGGIDGARKAALEYSQPDGPRFWFNPAFWISVVLLAMPLMLLVDVFYVHPSAYAGELRTQVVTGVLMVIGMVGGYWIGTSFSSAKKDERRQ